MNIYEKIQKAKELILKANLKKSGKNNFAGYTYYELADLLPTIIQICNELKLFTRVSFTNEFATLNIINMEEPSENVSYSSPMKELVLKGANAIQSLGGVETYQRRYLYMSAFDIIENDMFDGSPPMEEAPKNHLVELSKAITKFATKNGKDEKEIKKMLFEKIGVKNVNELTEKQVQTIITKMLKV